MIIIIITISNGPSPSSSSSPVWQWEWSWDMESALFVDFSILQHTQVAIIIVIIIIVVNITIIIFLCTLHCTYISFSFKRHENYFYLSIHPFPFDQYCHDRKTLVWDISVPKNQHLNHICSVIPFLLLGIGIDNIFVITQTFNTMGECWCCTRYTYYKKNNLIENSTNQQQKQQHHRQSWPKGLVRPWNTQVGKSPIC